MPAAPSPQSVWTDDIVDGAVPVATRDFGGDGPSVLLLHGAFGTLADWSPVAVRLTSRFRVVAMDLRGHGHSGDGPWTWQTQLDDVRRVVEHCGLGEPAVVGHSLGGMIAGWWAAANPRCPAAVNLDGTGGNHALELLDGVDPDRAAVWTDEVTRLNREITATIGNPIPEGECDEFRAARRSEMIALGVAAGLAAEQASRAIRVENGLGHPRPAAGTAQDLVRQLEGVNMVDVYAATRCPFLFVTAVQPSGGHAELGIDWYGEYEAAYRRGLARKLADIAEKQPLFHTREIDADHGLILNQPAAVAELVTHFVELQCAERPS